MKVGNTEYEWSGLIDNAVNGLDSSYFSWTKNMIKQYWPELEKEHTRLKDHNVRLVHEIVNLKARIEKRIEELETGEDHGTCSNPCIGELKKLLEKQDD